MKPSNTTSLPWKVLVFVRCAKYVSSLDNVCVDFERYIYWSLSVAVDRGCHLDSLLQKQKERGTGGGGGRMNKRRFAMLQVFNFSSFLELMLCKSGV